ncbi:Gfo/Idh/MocA family protein [Paenibacillus spongiae]|uniref:Gfo/Idh/MocA family oxidoreductase n=1 Tax=Paenibacillus spongiae TaxID=2909671 RepID=A0ABY5SGH4_9BACL|nr:Gfo/Idh/MocA family oxidoreductase [Paenibacillus spongiae]UVI33096.1 Gfo/Idh/MocA family oxidoreductase [Paenibacillus spongiae]
MTTIRPVRLAVIGGNRGFLYTKSIDFLEEKLELAAICDLNEEVLSRWKEKYPNIKTIADYNQVLEDPAIDAVFLATPMMLHARQAIAAMKAGKHVLCEVAAAHTLEECWEIVETAEQTGMIYMMAENFCYFRLNMMIRNMTEQKIFGDLTHAECGYIHDLRSATHAPDGSLTWRGEMLRDYNGNNYPTHSLGPVAQWLGIHRGDAFDYMMTIVSKPSSQSGYFAELFGTEHPGADPAYWKQGDSSLTLIRTKQGAVIYLRNDFTSARPFNYAHYALQGTKGAFLSARRFSEDPLVWLDDRSPNKSYTGKVEWSSIWDYAEEFEHPSWKRDRRKAEEAGFGGDYFCMEEFASAILEGRRPEIDVYDSVAMSCVFPLSVQSVESQGKPVSFPDFTKNRSVYRYG